MAGHGKAAVLARVARAWGALRVTLSGAGFESYLCDLKSERALTGTTGGCGSVDSRTSGWGETVSTHSTYVQFPMAGHGKAAVLARVARAWGALLVTLSGAGRVWYVRIFFSEGGGPGSV